MGIVAVANLAYRRLISGSAEVNLQNFRVAVMFPVSRRLARRQANASRPNQLTVGRSAFDLAHDFSRPRQMINHHRMADRRLDRAERSFLDDRRVKRTPTDILTVRDQAVAAADGAPMRFIYSENEFLLRRGKHSGARY